MGTLVASCYATLTGIISRVYSSLPDARVYNASAAVVFVFVIPKEFAAIVTNKYMEKVGPTSLGTDGSTSPPQDIKSFRGGYTYARTSPSHSACI